MRRQWLWGHIARWGKAAHPHGRAGIRAPGLLSLGAFVVLIPPSGDSLQVLLTQYARDLLKGWSGVGLLLAAIIAIAAWCMAHPLKAGSYFWQGLAWIFHFAGRHKAKAVVEEKTNTFLSRLTPHLSEVSLPRISVNWVQDSADFRLHEDGHVIVRLRREKSDDRNAMATLLIAAPAIMFPHARPYLSKELSAAIDLELVRRLAEQLGSHARRLLDVEILQPRVNLDPQLKGLLPVLHTIRAQGLFEFVLLQELGYVSNDVLVTPATPSLQSEAEDFVHWLYALATRPIGDERVGLLFMRHHFRIGFILAARQATAQMGTAPYERRLGIDLRAGARSIYLLGLRHAQTALCRQIDERFRGDRRLQRMRSSLVSAHRDGSTEQCYLSHYRRDGLVMPDGDWPSVLADLDISPGVCVLAEVASIRGANADLRVDVLDAQLKAEDVAWGYHGSADHQLRVGQRIEAVVLDLDDDRGLLRLGIKQQFQSPWHAGELPALGATVRVQVEEVRKDGVVVRLMKVLPPRKEARLEGVEGGPAPAESTVEGGTVVGSAVPEAPPRDSEEVARPLPDPLPSPPVIFGWIPNAQWSTYDPDAEGYVAPVAGEIFQAVVEELNEPTDTIVVSRARLELRDWGVVRRRYPRGTRVQARVVRVREDGLLCEIEPGVVGRFAAYRVAEQGYELADFVNSVVPGMTYEAVVIGAKETRRELRLEFARPAPDRTDGR